MLGRAARRSSPVLTALRPFAAPSACRPQTGLSPVGRDVRFLGGSFASSGMTRICGGLTMSAARRPQAACAAFRSLSTDFNSETSGSIVSSVFEGDEGDKTVVAGADMATADRHQNRHPKARALAEGKKTLKPWSGGAGGAKLNELMIDVATEHVKILIGKRGAKVQSMMEESGAKIFISRHEGQDSSKRRVAIRGTPEAVQKARELIEAQVQYAETTKSFHESETVQIPVQHVGLVIGKGGATIKAIEGETGAAVNIDTSKQRVGDDMMDIALSGDRDAVEKARGRIEGIIADARSHTPTAGADNRGAASASKERIVVPSSAVAMIIGKAGKNIRDLEAISGARVTVDQEGSGDTRTVSIWSPSGDASAVEKAKEALAETVAQAAKYEEMRQAGGSYGGDGYQPSKGKDGERRSRMFADRKEGRGRRDRGSEDAGRGRGRSETAAAVSNFVSKRTTVGGEGDAATLVDVGAEVQDLKAKGHSVDEDADALAQEVASILALNPTVSPSKKRAFVRRFIKNSARAEEEFKQVLEM